MKLPSLAEIRDDDGDGRRYAECHWGRNGEDVILGRIFGQQRNGFYVDIGANHPIRRSNTYFLHKYRNWSGINVDANEEMIELFKQARPDDVSIVSLVGESGEEKVFTTFEEDVRSTANAARSERLSRKFPVKATKSMSPRPLSALLAEHVPDGRRIDLMSVDIEGFDLQALRTNDWDKFRPRVVCVEDFNLKTGKSTKISQYMRKLGYVLASHCFDTSVYTEARSNRAA